MSPAQPALSPTNIDELDMRLGTVHLIVNDLEKELAFYESHLGLQIHRREASVAALGAGAEDLLVLEEDKKAPRFNKNADIYHVALRMSDRATLARAIARLSSLQWPNSPTDHLVSETTYLEDPEGNTIELTFETPSRGALVVPDDGSMPYAVRTDGKRQGISERLDLIDLMSELAVDEDLTRPLPGETRVHHVHLYASNLKATHDFYTKLIGFKHQAFSERFGFAELGPDGYPVHMLAFNTWHPSAPRKPAGSAGLKFFTIHLPSSRRDAAITHLEAANATITKLDSGYLTLDPSGLGVVIREL